MPRTILLLRVVICRSSSQHKATGYKGLRGVASRLIEKFLSRSMFNNAPVVHENDFLRQPSRLAYIMCDDNDLDSVSLRLDQQPLNKQRRSRIEACGWLVEEQDLGLKTKSARKT